MHRFQAKRITVWLLSTADFPPRLDQTWLQVLDTEECQKADRFHFEKDRQAYVAAHFLRRAILADHYGQPAALCQFQADSNGRPHIKNPVGETKPDCNITHTEGIVAVVLAEGLSVGIDAEPKLGKEISAELVATYCTEEELAVLTAFDADQSVHNSLATEFWVRKEAVSKALGLGLSLPFNTINVLDDTIAKLNAPPAKLLEGNFFIWRIHEAKDHHVVVCAISQTALERPIVRVLAWREAMAYVQSLSGLN